jgi:transposase
VRSLGVGARGIKTDRRDARVTSEVSTRIDLPSVFVPTLESRQHTALCSSRQVLVSSRTRLINHCRGWLRGQVERIRSGRSSNFPQRMRQLAVPLPGHIEALLDTLELINTQIAALDKQIEELAAADPICKRLMTVPGVGPVTALRFTATIGDIHRFNSAHAVQSYLGLVPGENSSGSKKQRTSLTKAGNSHVRWLLIQAAWSAWRTRGCDPMVCWAKHVAQRRGNFVAVVALARKMAGILYAIWRDESHYEPDRGARADQRLQALETAIES